MADAQTESVKEPVEDGPTWVAYVAPMAAFILMVWLEGRLPGMYVWIYVFKVCLVTVLLAAFRPALKDIRPNAKMIAPGVVVGLLVFVEWVVVDRWVPYPHLGTRFGLNPLAAIPDRTIRGVFLFFRFAGLALVVPVMEELFWRSFLLRLFTDQEWERIPIGQFSWAAFAIVAAMFGLAHPEWLVAVICAVAYGLLLRQTRSLFACVLAHGVTNFALGIYVLVTHAWKYW